MATPVLILYGYQPHEVRRRARLHALGQVLIMLVEQQDAYLLRGHRGKALLLAVRIEQAREEMRGGRLAA